MESYYEVNPTILDFKDSEIEGISSETMIKMARKLERILDKHNWQGYISKVMHESHLDREEIARICDVSRPTVERWIKGISAPMKPMRAYLVSLLGNKPT